MIAQDSPYWYRVPTDDVLADALVLADRGYWNALGAIATADLVDFRENGRRESVHDGQIDL